MEQRLQQLEAHSDALMHLNQQLQLQLGVAPCSASVSTSASSPVLQRAHHPGRLPSSSHTASVSARVQQLEARVERMAAAAVSSNDKLQAAAAAVQALDRKVGRQLRHVRADLQQALAVAAGTSKAELEASVATREHQAVHHWQQQLKGVCVCVRLLLLACHAELSQI